MIRRPRIALTLAVATLALAVAATPARAATPNETIDRVSSRVIEILKDKALDSATRRRRVEDVAYGAFDFDVVSKLVLARNWATLTPEQQKRFVDEFKQHLSVTYGKNLDSYANEKVVLLGDREEARGDWSVKTKIARGGGSDDILVDYRLRKPPGSDDWKIIDVTIEGVSLVANFRSQFQEIMASGGADRMLALLAEKNAKGESILPPEKRGGAKGETATAQP
ncbi:MAG: phospholipid-binding protein MlaC [Alphaproteobacteria bacterium]